MFPFAADGGGSCVEEEEISCVSGEGLAFAGRHLIGICYGSALGLQVQNCSFYRTSLVKVLMKNCSFAGCRF